MNRCKSRLILVKIVVDSCHVPEGSERQAKKDVRETTTTTGKCVSLPQLAHSTRRSTGIRQDESNAENTNYMVR